MGHRVAEAEQVFEEGERESSQQHIGKVDVNLRHEEERGANGKDAVESARARRRLGARGEELVVAASVSASSHATAELTRWHAEYGEGGKKAAARLSYYT